MPPPLLRVVVMLLCLGAVVGCVELETRPASVSFPESRSNSEMETTRSVFEVQATPVVVPSPADPTLDDDDDDEEEEDAEDAARRQRQSTAR